MADIGLVLHHARPEAVTEARGLADWLHGQGHEVRLTLGDAALAGLDAHGVAEQHFGPGLDLAVSLGGDGSILRAVSLVAADGVAVLGVNLGQLGYLTEVEPPQLRQAVERVLAGEHRIEERMLLDVQIERAGASAADGPAEHASALALNDVVLGKTPAGHTVRVEVTIDDEPFTPYAADGLIVATPTGSTAYNLSARGPIVAPTHRALVLTPVSPHMLFDRSLVLEPSTRLRLTVGGSRPASLAIDGRDLPDLEPGDAMVATASVHQARLVVFGPRKFHQILKAKFRLSDR
jgi:NAD+ kinase